MANNWNLKRSRNALREILWIVKSYRGIRFENAASKKAKETLSNALSLSLSRNTFIQYKNVCLSYLSLQREVRIVAQFLRFQRAEKKSKWDIPDTNWSFHEDSKVL